MKTPNTLAQNHLIIAKVTCNNEGIHTFLCLSFFILLNIQTANALNDLKLAILLEYHCAFLLSKNKIGHIYNMGFSIIAHS
jgi:hypothetical protein